MIQRIQSIYLLISSVLLSYLFFIPVAEYVTESNDVLNLFCYAFIDTKVDQQVMVTVPIVILLVITILLSLVTIFLYKNRRLQIRISIYNIVLMFGLTGIIYYYYKTGILQLINEQNITISAQKMLYSSLIPIFAAFFTYLAYKKILKDDALVKSIDRLR